LDEGGVNLEVEFERAVVASLAFSIAEMTVDDLAAKS
jgi:hypothetical protein